VAALYAVRNGERQAELFERRIVPAAGRVVDNARQAYAAGTGTFIDLIDAQRTLLEVRLTAAEARAAREKTLADLEALLGVDVERWEVPARPPDRRPSALRLPRRPRPPATALPRQTAHPQRNGFRRTSDERKDQ
jgi:hypothetical protein